MLTESSVSLPKVTDIRGNFNVQSTKDISSSCNVFDNEHGPNDVIKGGDYTCDGENPQATGTSDGSSGGSSSNGGSSSSGSGKSGAADPSNIPSMQITGVLGVIAAILGML